MDYNIKGPNSRNMYTCRIKDGSKYGRLYSGKTKQVLIEKLNAMWIPPTKKTKNEMTVGEVMKGYIDYMTNRSKAKIDGKKRIKPQSLKTYELHHSNIWNFNNVKFREGFGKRLNIFGQNIIDVKITNIDERFLKELLNQIELNFTEHSPKYKKETFNSFKSSLLWLHEQNKELYPMTHVQGFTVSIPKKEAFVPNVPDAQLILKTVDEVCTEKYALYVHFCARGLRASEANALKPEDFDFRNNTVKIVRMVDCYRNVFTEKEYEQPLKSLSAKRRVPLGETFGKRVKQYLNNNPDIEWLFQAQFKYDGKPIKQSNLAIRGIHKALKKLGSKVSYKRAMHPLRHYYSSLMLAEAGKKGLNPQWVAKRTGHGDLKTLFGTYSHHIHEDDNEFEEYLSKQITG